MPTQITQGKVCGLCGDFDGRSRNDFTTRGQSVEMSIQEFGNSWKITSTCSNINMTDLCADQPFKSALGQKHCSIIKSSVFEACHSKVILFSHYQYFHSRHYLLLCSTFVHKLLLLKAITQHPWEQGLPLSKPFLTAVAVKSCCLALGKQWCLFWVSKDKEDNSWLPDVKSWVSVCNI